MKERAIFFREDMIRAILDGRKTQTRRVITPQPVFPESYNGFPIKPFAYSYPAWDFPAEVAFSIEYGDTPLVAEPGALWAMRPAAFTCKDEKGRGIDCRYGQPGDRLWIKESYGFIPGGIDYKATISPEMEPSVAKWYPSRFMPRAVCRLVLEICSMRVERVQEISEKDVFAEGCPQDGRVCYAPAWYGRLSVLPTGWFAHLWDEINGKRPGCAWEANPWVWVLDFKRVS